MMIHTLVKPFNIQTEKGTVEVRGLGEHPHLHRNIAPILKFIQVLFNLLWQI